jgi:hypothetical protein
MPLDDTTPHTAGEPHPQQQPFRLFGSMRLNVPADEFDAWLEENRTAQADLVARKLGDL